ncbi:MAG: class I SAM-dependent methyltransferase [Verrucomicrobia bacterium]|nr:class I SAM-dependent methyltransferase [Verrucomicrobiota bacterium]
MEAFPDHILLHAPQRRAQLIQAFYEAHHKNNRDISQAKDDRKKLAFYCQQLEQHHIHVRQGIDLGCRGGALTRELVKFGPWLGVDLDRNAIALANANGIPCIEMDISTAIDIKDESVDAVCMTEVLEHLPYPSVTVYEIWRILEKKETSVFMGSVPLDYHLHRRYAVWRGKRLTSDPTHLRSFSYNELKMLLEHYFAHVEFAPMRGTKVRYPWLSWNHFVRDIAWVARGPRKDVGEWDISLIQ